jgi:hypothetical protein
MAHIMSGFVQSLMLTVLLTVTSCAPSSKTPLQRNAEQLAAGMNRADVDRLFHQFASGQARSFQEGVDLSGDAVRVYFATNVTRGYGVGYWPKGFFSAYEICHVYFDTNDVLVAYGYSRDGLSR